MFRVKERIKSRWAMAVTPVMLAVMSAVPAFAAEGDAPTFDLSATMTASVNKLVNDLLTMITAIMPTMITLFAASVGIAYAIGFVKKITGKAK